MPPHPRSHHPVEPRIETLDDEREPASRGRAATLHDDPDEVWVRVDAAGRDPSADRPSTPVSPADVEAELDGLEVDVVVSPLPVVESDLQRVVDRYERIIADRNRELDGRGRDGRPTIAERVGDAAVTARIRDLLTTVGAGASAMAGHLRR